LPVMYSLILLLGIAGGIGFPLGWAYLQPTFVSAAQLRGLGLPVIGTVTLVQNNASGAGIIASPLGPFVVLSALVGVYAVMLFVSTGVYRWLL